MVRTSFTIYVLDNIDIIKVLLSQLIYNGDYSIGEEGAIVLEIILSTHTWDYISSQATSIPLNKLFACKYFIHIICVIIFEWKIFHKSHLS